MSETSLRAYLRENDVHLTQEHLSEGLQHMAEHIYLLSEDSEFPPYNDQAYYDPYSFIPKKITPVYDHHDVSLGYSNGECTSRDIFYRCLKDPQCFEEDPPYEGYLYDVQDAFYCKTRDNDVFLYRDGAIDFDGYMYSVQATKLLDCFDSGIFYRNYDGYYYLLTNQGLLQRREDIPDPTNIQTLCYVHDATSEDTENIYIDYILDHNGNLCYQPYQELDDGNFILATPDKIKKILNCCKDEYWVLTEEGRLFRIGLAYEIHYICHLTDIIDIAMYDKYNVYALVNGRKIFFIDRKNYDDTFEVYTLDVTCDKLSAFVYGNKYVADRVILQLHVQ